MIDRNPLLEEINGEPISLLIFCDLPLFCHSDRAQGSGEIFGFLAIDPFYLRQGFGRQATSACAKATADKSLGMTALGAFVR